MTEGISRVKSTIIEDVAHGFQNTLTTWYSKNTLGFKTRKEERQEDNLSGELDK